MLPPYEYLVYVLELTIVNPQKISINWKDLKILNAFQKLLGDINWTCPSFGIPNSEFSNLFLSLEGDSVLDSPRELNREAHKELAFFMDQLHKSYLFQFVFEDKLWIFATAQLPTALIV